MVKKPTKSLHMVEVSTRVRRGKSSGRQKLWAFGVDDLAAIVGKTPAAVRKDIQRGKVDPADLRSLLAYASRYLDKVILSPPIVNG